MTRLRFLLVSFFAAVGVPAAVRAREEHPDSICIDRAPKYWRIDHVDPESLAKAYRDARWGWGGTGVPPTASEIEEAIKEMWSVINHLGYETTSSGGLAIQGGKLYAHERIYFRLPSKFHEHLKVSA